MKYKWLILVLVLLFGFASIQKAQAQDCSELGINIPANFDASSVSDAQVVVILTESINNNGLPMSCGRAIECIRNEIGKQKKPDGSAKYDSATARKLEAFILSQDKYAACVVTGRDGLDLLNNYATLVYRWIAGIVGSLCILIIIVSGIQISIGGLSQEEVGSAKERITRSLIGLVVLFLSAFILYTINPTFFT